MKNYTLHIIVLFALLLGLTAFATPPKGIPIPANPMLCIAPEQVPEGKIPGAVSSLIEQGCNNATWQHVANGLYVVYGTKVLIGE